MNVYISTNAYRDVDFGQVFSLLERFPGDVVGLEIFPYFDYEHYRKTLNRFLPQLREYPISFHGPYRCSEYSTAADSEEFHYSLKLLAETLEFVKALNSKYLVFHHNNCVLYPATFEEQKNHALRNQKTIAALCEEAGTQMVVENAGVRSLGTMMFDEEEFIHLCLSHPYKVLIDIGHAHANGWDLGRVIKALADKIISYHLHNNDGIHDLHQRIFDGTLDFRQFLENYRRFTPDADLVLEYLPETADQNAIASDLKYLLSFLS